MVRKHLLSLLLLLVSSFAYAQYPTSIGTTWQYFQWREDFFVLQDMMDCWTDVVVGDTVAAGNTYQIVRRSGFLYKASGIPWIPEYDTLDGTFYTRVAGTQVWVLDSVVSGNAVESLLYEFGIPVSGVPSEPLRNVVNLTPGGRIPFSHAERFDNEVLCAPQLCDPIFSFQFVPANFPSYAACSTWTTRQSVLFVKDVGTVGSQPYIIVLDQFGENYYLRTLTSNGQVLYRAPLLATEIDAAAELSQVQIYPNPATDRVRITSAFPLQEIRMMDGLGRMVLSQRVDGGVAEATLEAGDLPRGLYWLQASGETQTAMQAVILR
jgi:Secretion system C-terminal sorting domain